MKSVDKFLSQIPKNLLAILVVAGGTIFWVVLVQPLATVCDAQIEGFQKIQSDFLYKEKSYPKAKKLVKRKYQYLYENCLDTNSPGGCYEYFGQVRTVLHDLEPFTGECLATPKSIKEVDFLLWKTAELMVRSAWGEAPPSSYHAKFGWLDTADIALFCKLKSRIIAVYGQSKYDAFQNKMMLELPGAKDLPRNQIWDMTVFSENCARYP